MCLIKCHVLNTSESGGTDPCILNLETKWKIGQLHFADALQKRQISCSYR